LCKILHKFFSIKYYYKQILTFKTLTVMPINIKLIKEKIRVKNINREEVSKICGANLSNTYLFLNGTKSLRTNELEALLNKLDLSITNVWLEKESEKGEVNEEEVKYISGKDLKIIKLEEELLTSKNKIKILKDILKDKESIIKLLREKTTN